MTEKTPPFRLLVFVRNKDAEQYHGPILERCRAFQGDEMDIEEFQLDMCRPPRLGLLVLEGRTWWTSDADQYLAGTWRDPNGGEMLLLQKGRRPFPNPLNLLPRPVLQKADPDPDADPDADPGPQTDEEWQRENEESAAHRYDPESEAP